MPRGALPALQSARGAYLGADIAHEKAEQVRMACHAQPSVLIMQAVHFTLEYRPIAWGFFRQQLYIRTFGWEPRTC